VICIGGGGDLRRLRNEAGGDVRRLKALLTELKGIGGVDKRDKAAAKELGLPATPEDLAGLVAADDVARLVAAPVRTSLADDVRELSAARDS